MPTPPRSLVGQVIAGYRLDTLIGMGGAGAVFLGVALDGKKVAVKVLVPPTLENEALYGEFHRRFIREARTLSLLKHPHILPVYAFGEDEGAGYAYMTMPYISGGTLLKRLNEGLPSSEQVRTYVQQIADALDYAHEQNVIHRDLKPSNVLLDEDGHVYLADFGVAKLFDDSSTVLTRVNQAIGTPAYMAPEQVMNQPVSPATDVYGLGTLTYQLLTGRLPFSASSLLAIMQQIMYSPAPAPEKIRPGLPQAASDVLLRALAKDPAERFASAGAFARALERGLQGKNITPSPQSVLVHFTPAEQAALAGSDFRETAISSEATVPLPADAPAQLLPVDASAQPPGVTTIYRSRLSSAPLPARPVRPRPDGRPIMPPPDTPGNTPGTIHPGGLPALPDATFIKKRRTKRTRTRLLLVMLLLIVLGAAIPVATHLLGPGSLAGNADLMVSGAAYNNEGISNDNDSAVANFDDRGNSYSKQALAAGGFTSGAVVTVHTIRFTWPPTTDGMDDNWLAAGQVIDVSARSGKTLAFLGAAVNGPSTGTATITYTDGSTRTFSLTLTDWTLNHSTAQVAQGNSAALAMKYRNTLNGTQTRDVHVFFTSVALDGGKIVKSITLPASVDRGEIHVFALGIG